MFQEFSDNFLYNLENGNNILDYYDIADNSIDIPIDIPAIDINDYIQDINGNGDDKEDTDNNDSNGDDKCKSSETKLETMNSIESNTETVNKTPPRRSKRKKKFKKSTKYIKPTKHIKDTKDIIDIKYNKKILHNNKFKYVQKTEGKLFDKNLSTYDKDNILSKNYVRARGRGKSQQLKTMTKKEKQAEAKAILEKNRISAKECRKRKKIYVETLENNIKKYKIDLTKQENEIQNLQEIIGELEKKLMKN